MDDGGDVDGIVAGDCCSGREDDSVGCDSTVDLGADGKYASEVDVGASSSSAATYCDMQPMQMSRAC